MNRLDSIKINTERVFLFLALIVYKVFLEVSFVALLDGLTFNPFVLDFNPWKFVTGLLWIIVLFVLASSGGEKKASGFFFDFFLFVGIVPMAVLYGFMNYHSMYFNLTCVAFAMAEGLLRIKLPQKEIPLKVRIGGMDKIVLLASLCVMLGVTAIVVLTQGLPALTALNLRSVYAIRGENFFITNQYLGYAYSWLMTTILPFLLALSLTRKKYVYATVFTSLIFIFFLYSGNKTTLFCLPVIIGTYLFLRMFKEGQNRLLEGFSLGVSGIVVIALKNSTAGAFWMPFSLIVRRTLMLPAMLKFMYYDFFLNNPRLGMSGIYPGDLFGGSPYDEPAGRIIGSMYLDSMETNANTGFMVEGFERFGFAGIFIAFLAFALILFLVDRLQGRTSYLFAIVMGMYPIYCLNDGSLIKSILLGPMTIFILICLFYYNDDIAKEKYDHGIKICAR